MYGLSISDGVGRTGAFIATHAEMERMKAETVVDIFQFIKAARVQRARLVSNKASLSSEQARWSINFTTHDAVLLYRSSMNSVIKY